jgi:hypothetical protein
MQLKCLKYLFWGLTFPLINLFFLLIKPQAAYSFSGGQIQSFMEEVFKISAPELFQRYPIILLIFVGLMMTAFLISRIIDFFENR